MTEKKIKELTYEMIEAWIIANRRDMDIMNDLNRLTYPYTSKYREQTERGRQGYN